MKQRMTSVDVAGEAACLHAKLLGLRVANIYDINAKVMRASLVGVSRARGEGKRLGAYLAWDLQLSEGRWVQWTPCTVACPSVLANNTKACEVANDGCGVQCKVFGCQPVSERPLAVPPSPSGSQPSKWKPQQLRQHTGI